jgi:hypothetical protein
MMPVCKVEAISVSRKFSTGGLYTKSGALELASKKPEGSVKPFGLAVVAVETL